MAPPPEEVTQVGHVIRPLVALITSGLEAVPTKVPAEVGSRLTALPAAAWTRRIAVPEVAPASPTSPVEVPGMPSTGFVTAVGTAEAPVRLPSTVPPAIADSAVGGIERHCGNPCAPVSLPQNLLAGAVVPHCAKADPAVRTTSASAAKIERRIFIRRSRASRC